MEKEYVEIELTDYFGHKHKKKIYDRKIYFYTEGPCIVYHKDGWNVGKPVWFNENDIEQLHDLDRGYIELLENGIYKIIGTYKPINSPISDLFYLFRIIFIIVFMSVFNLFMLIFYLLILMWVDMLLTEIIKGLRKKDYTGLVHEPYLLSKICSLLKLAWDVVL